MNKVTPFLMFQNGDAEEAMSFYALLFEDAEIESIVHFGSDEGAPEGSVKAGVFSLKGQQFRCFDSPIEHAFHFTPSSSIFVECDSEEEIDRLYRALVEGGQALMELGNHGFSRKYGWVNDRHGVSWQLNLS
ncbi:UNVERIFIED_CONTAM: VOC family protein [Halobacillus marinus]|uniref:VOC family protein n=1 Tax=Bacillus sp. SB49 TaxID=1071080 RepID=UPI0003F9EAFA|nr:VOC family protein [Bacillus sp. SB49]QHT47879.1 VOC family protein [Bacillus sp. SB49]